MSEPPQRRRRQHDGRTADGPRRQNRHHTMPRGDAILPNPSVRRRTFSLGIIKMYGCPLNFLVNLSFGHLACLISSGM